MFRVRQQPPVIVLQPAPPVVTDRAAPAPFRVVVPPERPLAPGRELPRAA